MKKVIKGETNCEMGRINETDDKKVYAKNSVCKE